MSGTDDPGVTGRIDRLADELTALGGLADPRWRAALHAVPRHRFVPRAAWAVPDRPGGTGFPIDLETDPAAWWDAVYADTAIATQVAEGAGDPAQPAGPWTSSCSAPGVVVTFLEALRPLDHHRVLEIGTGSGWTAGLLTSRLGPGLVTSVEIDEALAARAAANLASLDLSPHLVVGDGAAGDPSGAPYDRVHVTCGVDQVPSAWAAQTRPGGVIVLPWSPGWGIGHLAVLTVTTDGAALGRLSGPAGFMMLRSQRRPGGPPAASATGAKAAVAATRTDPRGLLGASPGAEVAIAALVPGVRAYAEMAVDGSCRFWAIESRADDPAWASVDFLPGRDDYPVHQYGDRRLWDEVETAYQHWIAWGRPDRDRFGLTAAPSGQQVWLDRPDQPLPL
ncbi:methyltransferase domain-containing protein [Actinomadura oligospora]|uniref:methyltransferase domain-containing protein n=1 Tax=Actinomadura oligospora TaxID=111804 RepID=UPI0004B12BEB|nr:methyltransferase domain-containing protein [Actinomadura oligospora]